MRTDAHCPWCERPVVSVKLDNGEWGMAEPQPVRHGSLGLTRLADGRRWHARAIRNGQTPYPHELVRRDHALVCIAAPAPESGQARVNRLLANTQIPGCVAIPIVAKIPKVIIPPRTPAHG